MVKLIVCCVRAAITVSMQQVLMASGCIAALVTMGTPFAHAACPPPPAAVTDIDTTRFYTDKESTIADPALVARHRAEVGPLTEFLRHVTSNADRALRKVEKSAAIDSAQCALGWLAAWSKGNAWLGHMGNQQAEYQRIWDLAGTALAYIKLKPYATEEQRAAIEPWLIKWADKARSYFDDASHKRNNHWYWLALGVGATAITTGSERHWTTARGIMEDASRDIRADGSLPLEMERKRRALHYHAFAVTPLVLLAELGRSRGEDWYAIGDGALHRLVGLTLRGVVDPAVFDQLAGVPQERPVNPGSGWLGIYAMRFPDRLPKKVPEIPVAHRWLGGNVNLLVEALERKN